MEDQASQDNEVAIIQNSLPVLYSAGEILISNRNRKEKAIEVGKNILLSIQDGGMNPVTDERAMKYLTNIANAAKEMKEQRTSVTQIMDNIKSMYTQVENELDIKKAGSVPNQIQSHRNQYAQKVAEEQRQEKIRLQKIADKAKEAVDLKYKGEQRLVEYYNAYLLKIKSGFRNKFNEINLLDFDTKSIDLKSYEPEYKIEHFNSFSGDLYSPTGLTSTEEIDEIRSEIMEGKYQEFASNYRAEMISLRDELILELPSKKTELDEAEKLRIAAEKLKEEQEKEKDKEKKELLKKQQQEAEKQQELQQQQQKQREAEATAKLKEESEEKLKEETQNIAVNKQGAETLAMFDHEANLAEVLPAVDARTGFTITVLHPVGFTQIFAMWFEKVGKDLPVDKIGNTKLDQMKAWAEKVAKSDGFKIDSKFIKYEDSYKAVNKKAAKTEE